jgi:hypothetical protein
MNVTMSGAIPRNTIPTYTRAIRFIGRCQVLRSASTWMAVHRDQCRCRRDGWQSPALEGGPPAERRSLRSWCDPRLTSSFRAFLRRVYRSSCQLEAENRLKTAHEDKVRLERRLESTAQPHPGNSDSTGMTDRPFLRCPPSAAHAETRRDPARLGAATRRTACLQRPASVW